jgi:hypothetical protein
MQNPRASRVGATAAGQVYNHLNNHEVSKNLHHKVSKNQNHKVSKNHLRVSKHQDEQEIQQNGVNKQN